MYLSSFRHREVSDQQKKCSDVWGFHHRGLISEMGLLHEVHEVNMLLYQALQISHLSPVLIVSSQEKLIHIVKVIYIVEVYICCKIGEQREFVLSEVSFMVEDCILLIAK